MPHAPRNRSGKKLPGSFELVCLKTYAGRRTVNCFPLVSRERRIGKGHGNYYVLGDYIGATRRIHSFALLTEVTVGSIGASYGYEGGMNK